MKKIQLLSKIEYKIAILICKDFTNVEIAKQLGLTTRSIEGHRFIVYRKLGVTSAVSLVYFAMKYGMIKPVKPYKKRT